MGDPPFSDWQKTNPKVKLATCTDAVKDVDMILEALHGAIVVEVLKTLESILPIQRAPRFCKR